MATRLPNADRTRDEILQLRVIARISRSQAAFEKSLKEKCMDSIFQNAKNLEYSRSTSNQAKCISPAVRVDFLKKLQFWAGDRMQKWTDQELDQVLGVLGLLLDGSIAEFNFKILGQRFERDQETWKLLVDRCPNLTRIKDMRVGKTNKAIEQRKFEWNSLLKLKKLEHVKMNGLVCTDAEFRQLVDTLPYLCTLLISVKYLDITKNKLQKELFKLQKLESLLLGLHSDKKIKNSEHLLNELLFECVQHFPSLREASIIDLNFDKDDEPIKAFYNSRQEVLGRPLALQSLRVKKCFKGWSCDRLPNVTDLNLVGPLLDPNEFLGFTNITSLILDEVLGEQVMQILRVCGPRLEKLVITNGGYTIGDEVDPFELFMVCRNLKSLMWINNISKGGEPEKFPVSAENFRNLISVNLQCYITDIPSALLEQILKAPHLEEFEYSPFNLKADQIQELSRRLQNREILQNLREFNVHFADTDDEQYFKFLKLLAAYGRRLKLLKYYHSDDELFPAELLQTFAELGVSIELVELTLDFDM